MARSPTSGTRSGNVRVKEEKVRVKTENSKGKARARHATEEPEEPEVNGHDEQEDAGEDQDDAEEEAEEGASPRGAKRVRVNDEGDSVPGGSQLPLLPRVKTQPRGDDGYIPGSIVRIQLQNFVTYDFVEFFPGPYLNMIIGPNGTGKSSIACAIALGLNFPPNILGRASEINSFVKHGAKDGYIEIELKGPKGKKNLTIRRSLYVDSKSSSFSINGTSASGKEVSIKMAELNVQVGNLCSFLPQDRVTEFAAMTPQELLKQTELAAGDENLTNWHKTLIEDGKQLKDAQSKIKGDEDSVKHFKELNEGIERDVQKFKERKIIERKINLLNLLIPVVEYKVLREEYGELKEQQKKLKAKVERLSKKNEPALKRLKKYEQACKEADKARNDAKDAARVKCNKAYARTKEGENLATLFDEVVEKLSSLRDDEKRRKQDLKRCREEINALNIELNKDRPSNLPDDAKLAKELNDLGKESNTFRELRGEIEAQLTDIKARRIKFEHQLSAAKADLSKQNDDDVKKLNSMSRWDADTHAAIQWVRTHRELFNMEVFETPFMRLTVKDQRFADAVETCFNSNQLRTFVCQCQEDMDTLNHYINDTPKALGRAVRINTWFRPSGNPSPQPLNPDQMRSMGFDAYAIDVVDFPEGMRVYLSQEVGLHRVPISLRPLHDDALVHINQTIGAQGAGMYIGGQNAYNISRSRYGRRLISSSMRGLKKAVNLSVPKVDPDLEKRCNALITEAEREIKMCDEAREPLVKQSEDMEDTRKDLERRGNDLNAQRQEVIAYKQRQTNLKTKLASKMQRLTQLENMPSVEQEEKKQYKKLRELGDKRVRIASDITELGHSIVELAKEAAGYGLKYLQLWANKDALKELVDRKDAKFAAAKLEFAECDKKYREVKERTTELRHRCQAVMDEAEPDLAQEMAAVEEEWKVHKEAVRVAQATGGPMPPPLEGMAARTLEDLQSELDMLTEELNMNMHTNEDVVRQYETRAKSIEDLEASLVKKRKEEQKILKSIKTARDNWQPALQTLVNSIGAKFSAAFDAIGCAGEVRISEHEDYDKWAIDILVKFRDTEKLQLLTAHRQSGGERSLTTILYLLSLTEEARAPFSLVDEINQGMDQRAERHVHNSMVNVTCKEEAAQYFLITPKLLTDLKYHERMKILCVNNGEWLPEESSVGNLNHMIDTFLAARGGGGGGRAAM